ncbi:hypothetical protein LCGC14_0351640 [marine sediment metagenome]|uniref:Uncharacterized protein n=1 Tax=marine sediment metagenome TaxID=412755 RepID=A0A0F9TAT3_9ZZZZ
MCLSVITKITDLPKWGVGYKSVDSKFRPMIFHYSRSLIVGQTYDDPQDYSLSRHQYRTGYHIFKSKKAAKCYQFDSPGIVIKVRYSKVTAIGLQAEGEVIVARRITILEEVT